MSAANPSARWEYYTKTNPLFADARETGTTTQADSAAVPDDIPWSFAFGSPIPFSAPLCSVTGV